mgnify:CR=1 FL=1
MSLKDQCAHQSVETFGDASTCRSCGETRECRREDLDSATTTRQCAGLLELGTEIVHCENSAEWLVGDEPACGRCIDTFLDDEKPTGVAPITSQPTPTVDACLYHRCVKHLAVPQINTEENGSECGACIASLPIPMLLECPDCGSAHEDLGEWATRPHKTHRCLYCKREWRPSSRATVGVLELHEVRS